MKFGKGHSYNLLELKEKLEEGLSKHRPVDQFSKFFPELVNKLKALAQKASTTPLTAEFFARDPFERHLAVTRETGRFPHVELILDGKTKLPEHFASRLRELLSDPDLSKGKQYVHTLAAHLIEHVNTAMAQELAKITSPEEHSRVFQELIQIWPGNTEWRISELLLQHDKRLQGQIYKDFVTEGQEGELLFLPQVTISLEGLPGRNQATRTPDFLVYLVPGKTGVTVRVVILDVKTGYKNSPVDAAQAQDYFLAVEQFAKRGGSIEQIRKTIADAIEKSGKGVDVSLGLLRLVQVDWVFMPGKGQAGTMSAREVAVGKARIITDMPKNENIRFRILFYEIGNIKPL